jgi:hypothetical protein
MFGPQGADSIELNAHYYRKDTERWAADARLAKQARAGRQGFLARALSGLGSLFGGRRTATQPAPVLLAPRQSVAPVTPLLTSVVGSGSEKDLFDGGRETAAA